jgi:AraC-like DNA-binding protein
MRRRAEGPPRALAPLPTKPAILAPIVTNLFEELRVSAALHVAATPHSFDEWFPIRQERDVIGFEFLHDKDQHRWRYNARCLRKARRNVVVLGEHAGFSDFWVPVGKIADSWGTLVVGPFATRRPTSGDVLTRFRWLTGSQGRLGDPSFSHYLSMTLGTLTLEGALLHDFQRLLVCLSRLFEGSVDDDHLAGDIAVLRSKLLAARFAERMWDEASAMVDERTARMNSASAGALQRLGLERLPEHVVVGLLLGRQDVSDPVDEVIRRDAYQRACVTLMRKRGGVACGRIMDHGVLLLVDDPRTGARQRAKLVEVGERAAALAKRFGLRLHLGVSPSEPKAPLWRRYQMALSAAEKALSQGVSLVHTDSAWGSGTSSLARLRKELGQALAQSPSLLSPRFQRYIEAAQVHCGYRLEPTRAHLEAGFDQIADALAAGGTMDEKSMGDLRASIERDAAKATTVSELSIGYRRGISEVELALTRPVKARRDQAVQRAIAFTREHLSEPLSLDTVARVAGFAVRHFSKLFAESEKVTFQSYVRHLRLERAKSMLLSTTLSAERVGQLSGFGTKVHFHRTFKESLGITPLEYRRRER